MSSNSNNKTCFHQGCSVQGSDLKVCSKCKSAWYCSAECQKANWKVHKTDCKFLSSMKEDQGIAAKEGCTRCHNKNSALKKCSQCLEVAYCSKECQVADWKEHKPLCHHIVQGRKPKSHKMDDWGIPGIDGQEVWDEMQEKGYKMAIEWSCKEKEQDKLFSFLGDDDLEDDDPVANNLDEAVSIARDLFDDRKIVTNLEMVPPEMYGFRICQGQQILIALITGYHPEVVRHGVFVTDDTRMSTFVLFHMDNIPDPRPHFKWSQLVPGNYICVVDPSFQKFPGKFLGLVIDDASDVKLIKGTPLCEQESHFLKTNIKTHS